MKTATPALIAYLASAKGRDATLIMPDCYVLTLGSGLVLNYTNADVPVTYNGTVFVANSILIDGLQYKCATGLDVDKQKITISAKPTDLIGTTPFLQAMRNGILDGCLVKRFRVFLSSWQSAATPIGGVLLFMGRVTTIDSVGRTSAEVTVASDLILLDLDMPRNLYQPTCNHVLYDQGCGLSKAAYGANGTVGSGATASTIPWASASGLYAQGTITFTSGANTGISRTVKNGSTTALTLASSLPSIPAVGDAFTAYQGCDHTLATCKAKFHNSTNYRGFPFVPTPDTAFVG